MARDDRALDNLGTALFQQGRPRDALESYQQRSRRTPRTPSRSSIWDSVPHGVRVRQGQSRDHHRVGARFRSVREYQNQPARTVRSIRTGLDLAAAPVGRAGFALAAVRWRCAELAGSLRDRAANFSWVVLIVGIASVLLGAGSIAGCRCSAASIAIAWSAAAAPSAAAQAMCANCARVAAAPRRWLRDHLLAASVDAAPG